jgi:demethylmenaquinone methyltransferase/2-methoxy-6-polyprenyl-1,4-benzoquinol methylase
MTNQPNPEIDKQPQRKKNISLRRFPRDSRDLLTYCNHVFGVIANRYNLMKFILSFGLERRWKSEHFCSLIGQVPTKCLDIATGTGDFIEMLTRDGGSHFVVAFDLTDEMLQIARASCPHTSAVFVRGDLNHLPFTDGSFELVTIGYGLRYCLDTRRFLESVHRTLRPGGRFFCFDVGHPDGKFLRAVWFIYLYVSGSILGTVLHGNPATYWHLVRSLQMFPGQSEICDLLSDVGFRKVRSVDVFKGMMSAISCHK